VPVDEGLRARVEQVLATIGDICTGPLGRTAYGKHQLEYGEVRLEWNPAGVVTSGFGPGPIDSAPGVASNYRRPAGSLFGKNLVTTSLWIDEAYGSPNVSEVLDPGWGRQYISRRREATNDDLTLVGSKLTELRSVESGQTELPVFVEIGYGLDPSVVLGNRTFRNKQYIGVETAVGQYGNTDSYPDAVRRKTARLRGEIGLIRPGEHIDFRLTDGRLPVGNNSVREIYAANVLNAPGVIDDKLELLGEIRRILEPNGTVVLRVNWEQDTWPEAKTTELLRSNGFTVWQCLGRHACAYARLDEQYGAQKEVAAPPGYYVVAGV